MASPTPQHDGDESAAVKLQRRNYELTILNLIAEALNREIDLSRALQSVLGQVAELLGLRTGWIWLFNEESGDSYLAAAQNLPPALAHNPRRMEGTCYCLDTFRQGDLAGAANVNVVTCTRLKNLIDGTDGLRYHASIPLVAHGRQLGVLNVASPGWRELTPDELRLLYTVGDLLSIAIERARLFAHSVEMGAIQERNRLAREIHDTLAQGLTAITLQLEAADLLLEDSAAPERRQRGHQSVQRALDLARANLDEARRSVLDLRAAPLEGRPLTEALALMAEECQARSGIKVAFEAIGGGIPLPTRIEVGLYRIAQEALTNIVSHARARNIYFQIEVSLDQARLIIEDDGIGFNPDHIPEGHFGLAGMSERAHLLGGQLEVQSNLGAGTRLQVIIPMEQRHV
jgi:two-component system NarL family sensor kinase